MFLPQPPPPSHGCQNCLQILPDGLGREWSGITPLRTKAVAHPSLALERFCYRVAEAHRGLFALHLLRVMRLAYNRASGYSVPNSLFSLLFLGVLLAPIYRSGSQGARPWDEHLHATHIFGPHVSRCSCSLFCLTSDESEHFSVLISYTYCNFTLWNTINPSPLTESTRIYFGKSTRFTLVNLMKFYSVVTDFFIEKRLIILKVSVYL